MSSALVFVLDSGLSNLASIEAALLRAGLEPRRTREAAAIQSAERLVLPGVGSFGAAMAELQRLGLAVPLKQRLEQLRPTLAICLGMQLLASASEESPGVAGLGFVSGRIERFPESVAVPQLGWNQVQVEGAPGLVEAGYYNFANSYRLTSAPAGWRAAWSDHGGPFVAALERGGVLACQFHPELSGALGARLIADWIEATRPAPEEVL